MVIAVVAACAVLAACLLAVLVVRRSRRESERRLEVVLERVSSHLDAISTSVEQAVVRMIDAQRERSQPLSLDFDVLVDALIAEAAARTGADAVVLRVEGPGGRPVLASLGAGAESELVERTFAPPDARPFRAATIDWTYSASGEADDEGFRSALVAPLAPSTGMPGTLVAYSSTSHAFRAEHASALHGLIAEFGTGLANARRFADVEARLLLDPTTGVASRRGYEVELGREVARAHRTGRPLSVVLVGINGTETATTTGRNESVDQVARLLTRVTRKSDISCRRGDGEFAILMPETRESGAHVLTTRLREEAKRALGQSPTTIAVGHVEWRPDEPVEALEARVEAALMPERRAGPSKHPTSSAPPGDLDGSVRAETLRRDALDTLGREVARTRRHGESLTVLVVGLEGLDELSQRIDRDSADAALSRVAQQLSDGVGNGSVHRLGSREFALVLAVGAALTYSAVMLGPWGGLKMAAYSIGTLQWFMYATVLLGLIYVILPGLFVMAVALGRALTHSKDTTKKSFVAFAYALVPLGLMAWIAFSLSFVFASLSYVWPALSDPLGAGWNLFGTANVAWQPYLMSIVPFLQAGVLIGGLGWACVTARRIAAEKQQGRNITRQALPVMGFCFIITTGLLGLLIG